MPANAHARMTLEVIERLRLRARPTLAERALVVSRTGAFFKLGGDVTPVIVD